MSEKRSLSDVNSQQSLWLSLSFPDKLYSFAVSSIFLFFVSLNVTRSYAILLALRNRNISEGYPRKLHQQKQAFE